VNHNVRVAFLPSTTGIRQRRKKRRQHIHTHNKINKQEIRLVKKIVNRKKVLSMFTKKNNNNKEKVHPPLYTTVLKRTVKTHALSKGVQLIFISDEL
jgi:hypothetical protein